MYLRRKIHKWLIDWKSRDDKCPALTAGIRQCGKTRSIEQFGKGNYENTVEINFWNNPEYCRDFDGSPDVDTLISNISLRFPAVEIKPENALLIFDEIQECPRASDHSPLHDLPVIRNRRFLASYITIPAAHAISGMKL